ncbi:hypothetical protein [Tellurirhabdus bombi]|uniref:hypothetical protein n=1 Tax=Tellurirhabdus bombi TaxID=2907205 RepID=UPI001F1B5C2C|nr:hypothetical protein [Tellurirhabdus bombi]
MEVTSQSTSSNQDIVKVTIGVLVGVLSLLSYLFLGSRNETIELQKSLTTKVEELSSTQTKLDSISKVLDEKIIEVRQLGGSIAELENIKSQLERDKERFKYDFDFSVKKYENKIKDYENFLVSKTEDIRKIKEENGSLLSKARLLEEEKKIAINEITDLKSEKEALRKTVADYTVQNDDLKYKVTLASAMKAINIQTAALSSKGKERSGGSYKASRIDRLKISFIMPSNPVAYKNNKDIYVRILDPNGSVLSENGVGGTLYFNGDEIGYSARQPVYFENNDQKVDVIYRRNLDYKPGKYTIELYTEGFNIGNGSFEVK